jgi:hypothetical protein
LKVLKSSYPKTFRIVLNEQFADHILEKFMFARMLKNRKEGPRTILYLPVLRTDHDAVAWTFAVTCEQVVKAGFSDFESSGES